MDTLFIEKWESVPVSRVKSFLEKRNSYIMILTGSRILSSTMFKLAVAALALSTEVQFSGDDEDWCRRRLTKFTHRLWDKAL